MSDLIVIAYDDELTAETVLDDLLGMRKGYLVDLEDAAVVRRDQKGHLHGQLARALAVKVGADGGRPQGDAGQGAGGDREVRRDGTANVADPR
jgi:uncharacterized membrane protein